MVGNGLIQFARAWFDETTVSQVFEPLIADWQRECLETSGPNRLVCRARGYACFAMSFAIALPRQIQRRLPEKVTFTGWLGAEAFVALGVIAQITYMQYQWATHDVQMSQPSLLFPAAVGTALPLALVPTAIILINLRGVCPHQARAMTMRLALIAMVVLIPLLIWITPNANQSWRKAQVPDALRGMRELTIPELLVAEPPVERGLWQPRYWDAERKAELRVRASVLMMPVTMTILGVALGSFVRRRVVLSAGGWWLVATVVCLFDIDAIWITHAVPLGLAAVIAWQTQRRPLNVPS